MDGATTGVLLGLMCISLLADICFTVFFLRIRKLREGPGQLILAQTQAQILLDLHWLTLNTVWQDKGETSCAVAGFFTMSGYMLSCAYSSSIIIYSATAHFPTSPRLWLYHTVVISVSECICILMAVGGGLGKSAVYTCSILKGSWAE